MTFSRGSRYPSSLFSSLLPLICFVAAEVIPRQCPWDTIGALQYRNCPLPVDDESGPRLSEPWTHTPFCLTTKSEKYPERFCVYSASAFNENRGLSMIVTPDVAASVFDAVNNASAAYEHRLHILGQEEVQLDEFDREVELPYEVVPVPDMGKGVIATRKIKQFDTIMTGFPAVIVDNTFFPQDEDMAPVEGTRLYQRALDQLTDKERILNMAKSRGGDMHVVEDVVRTNAFGMTLAGRKVKGLYPEIAMMNHACDPNAFGRLNMRTLAIDAIATRDIEPGEEIFISYLPLGVPYKYRQRGLKNWGFTCTCSMCSASEKERNESDWRRERLVKIYDQMHFKGTDYDGLVELTREFVDVVMKERLIPKIGEYYAIFMRIFYSYGDTDSAVKYARTALRFAEAFDDPEGNFCTTLKEDLGIMEKELEAETASGQWPK